MGCGWGIYNAFLPLPCTNQGFSGETDLWAVKHLNGLQKPLGLELPNFGGVVSEQAKLGTSALHFL